MTDSSAVLDSSSGDVIVPLPGRSRLRAFQATLLWAPLAVLVVVLTAWQAGVFHAIFGLKLFTVPYPAQIVTDLGKNVPAVVGALAVTLPAALLGYGIGMTTGFLIASFLVQRAPRFVSRVVPLLSSFNAMPIAALAPLASLWFGSGFAAKVAVIVAITTPSMTVYAVRGMTSVEPVAIELMATLDAAGRDVYRFLRLPTALPFLFAALKACVVLALIGAIVSETVTGLEGLGWLVEDSLGAFQSARGWTALLAIAGLGITWYLTVGIVERLVMPWERERAK